MKFTPHHAGRWKAAAAVFIVASAAGPPARADDIEPNDAFADASVLASGQTTVTGQLTGTAFQSELSGTLSSGVVNQHLASDPAWAGGSARVILDNTSGFGEPDTVLGWFTDASFMTLGQVDDDSSPFGNSRASALEDLPIGPDGLLPLAVSGFPDDTFSGDHSEEGDYDLLITVRVGASDATDFYRFTGLSPGVRYNAELTGSTFDTVLGHFDGSTGVLLATDDDGGEDLQSRLEGLAPSASGDLVLGVSGYPDFGFSGGHAEFGEYTLALTEVPEPFQATVSAAGGLLAFSAWRRWRSGNPA